MVTTQTTAPIPVSDSAVPVRTSAIISNLQARVVYVCRLVVSNANGTCFGATKLFITGGKVHAWGNNYALQLELPASLTNIVAVAAGGAHCLALNTEGKITAWGWSYYSNYGQTNVPPAASNIIAIAAGGAHSLALRRDGILVAWGAGQPGQSDHPHYGQSIVPAGLSNVVAMSAGGFHNLALRDDGTLVAWGGWDPLLSSVPPGLSNIVAVASGSYHNLALQADGTVVAWGSNSRGQTQVPVGLQNVIAIACGNSHSQALLSNGTVVVWGEHYNNSEGTRTGPIPAPAQLTNGVAIASGANHSVALQHNGSIIAWGYDPDLLTAVPVSLIEAAAIATGPDVNLAIGGRWGPTVDSQSVTGPANYDLEITLGAHDNDGDPLGLYLTALPVAGQLYQYASGTRGSPITATNTWISDSERRILYAPPTNAFGTPYTSFRFAANDGELISAAATISINIDPPLPAEITSCGYATNGAFALGFTGDANTPYHVQTSTNLTDWEYLGPATQSPPGVFYFIDSSAKDHAQRFYRISADALNVP
ncbi:MAG: hypothetical protein QM813_03715 [Verrucomicrobiota bacterium]